MPRNLTFARLACLALLAALAASCTTPAGKRLADVPLSDDPLFGKFVWHDLITDDVQAATAFYGGLLGWTFEETTHPGGGDYTVVFSGERLVAGGVALDDPADADYSRWLGYLSVQDVDAAVGATRSAGGSAVAGPLDLPNVGRAAAIQDPQGAVVGLIRSDLGDPDDSLAPQPGVVVWNEMLASDDAAAAAFYAAIGGLQVREESRPGGVYRVLSAQGKDRSAVMQRPNDDIEPFWLTHFAVGNVAEAAERAEALGGEVLLGPDPELRDGTIALVVDPTGAVLALQQWMP
jgi:predicted enzyme related to lactoylglutathione lyase